MQFKDVIGQQAIKERLCKSVHEKRISHAQLLLGNTGFGTLALALAYSQMINCRNPLPDDSCGRCSSCAKLKQMVHPDLHFVYPTVGSKATSADFIVEWREALRQNPYMNAYQWLQHIKAENKQGNITSEECDHIMRKLSLTSFERGYKILLLWMPEYLGKEGNRLLKIIEEPPPNTLFLLVAENSEAIIGTILSRVQTLKVPRLLESDLQRAIEKKNDIDPESARQLAVLSEGDYNEAVKLIGGSNFDNQQMLIKWLNACMHKHFDQIDATVEKLNEQGREGQKNFIRYMLHFFRQCLLIKSVNAQQPALSKTELLSAQKFMQRIDWQQIDQLTEQFDQAFYHIERNANARILFFNLSIRLADAYSVGGV